MGIKTKISWCDATWNPVTGCLHGCEYCYARKIAERFGGASETHNNETCHECQWCTEADGSIHDLTEPIYDHDHGRFAPYPFEFDPTFLRYKLDEPQKWKKPNTIFVCSMADLFGEWVPEEWIQEVFAACDAAPQHRYLFLTKNPKRYVELLNKGMLPAKKNWWYGSTVTDGDTEFFYSRTGHDDPQTFVSVEPILKDFGEFAISELVDWVIVGAETRKRKGKVIPEKDWILEISESCTRNGVPVFMKESLRGIMGNDFKQRFPWEFPFE